MLMDTGDRKSGGEGGINILLRWESNAFLTDSWFLETCYVSGSLTAVAARSGQRKPGEDRVNIRQFTINCLSQRELEEPCKLRSPLSSKPDQFLSAHTALVNRPESCWERFGPHISRCCRLTASWSETSSPNRRERNLPRKWIQEIEGAAWSQQRDRAVADKPVREEFAGDWKLPCCWFSIESGWRAIRKPAA